MTTITNYRDLIAWQKAMDLADLVYRITESFPPRERFGLAFQLRKSAVSIPSNIAEGSRHRTPTYIHHLIVALGSHGELDTQCELATRRRYFDAQQHTTLEPLLKEVGRLTRGLLNSLDRQSLWHR